MQMTLIRKLIKDHSGGAAVTLAIAMSGVLGLTGLGTEAAGWYVTKRSMQGAVDAAAYTGALAVANGATTSQVTTEARSIAGSYNFINGSGGVTVTVNNPPQSGSHANDTSAVEVLISQPQTALISAMFLSTGPTITARAVASAGTASGSGCVLALDHGNVNDITNSGNTNLYLNSCSLYVNSSSSSALRMTGTSSITAAAAYVTGNTSIGNNASLTTSNGTFTGVNPISDPYANVNIPSYSGCDQTNFSLTAGQSQTINAGASGTYVFCNGLSLAGGSSLTLGAGTYIIDRGTLNLVGNSTLTATSGTTIVLTSSTGNNYAAASIASNAVISITAPSSGALAGIAIYQDRNAPNNASSDLTGGSTQNIVGAIYFPNQNVNFTGGSNSGAVCTQLIAYTLNFVGNSSFNSTCGSVGTRTIGSSASQLVE